jgi:hypothetical protein
VEGFEEKTISNPHQLVLTWTKTKAEKSYSTSISPVLTAVLTDRFIKDVTHVVSDFG